MSRRNPTILQIVLPFAVAGTTFAVIEANRSKMKTRPANRTPPARDTRGDDTPKPERSLIRAARVPATIARGRPSARTRSS